VGGWGYNKAFSSTSTGTQCPARRKRRKKGGQAEERKKQRARKESRQGQAKRRIKINKGEQTKGTEQRPRNEVLV
jgi:hypothetical protein